MPAAAVKGACAGAAQGALLSLVGVTITVSTLLFPLHSTLATWPRLTILD